MMQTSPAGLAANVVAAGDGRVLTGLLF